MRFEKWLDVFLSEKGIDLEIIMSVPGPSGENMIPVKCLVELIKRAPKHERDGIKLMLIRINFLNGSVLDYFKHLARAIAI